MSRATARELRLSRRSIRAARTSLSYAAASGELLREGEALPALNATLDAVERLLSEMAERADARQGRG